MSQILYEQYKDALRRGHVAALRGRLDAAVAAYEAAAVIAPDRALPHASLGDVYRRLGRIDAAESAYAAALQRAPGDETALRGRAEMRTLHGNRLDAARDFEALAETLEQAGRLVDATDAARRALELAELRTRRRSVERLAAVLREQDADPTAAESLRLAMQLLEPMRPASVARAGLPAAGLPGAADERHEPASDAEDGTEAAEGAAPDVPEAPPLDPVAALLEAEALIDARDLPGAREVLLGLATWQRRMGRLDAALDACLVLMAIDPSDTVLQLEIAANQEARGWSLLAAEKVRLLGRLAELDGNVEATRDIAAFMTAHGIAGAGAPAASGAEPVG